MELVKVKELYKHREQYLDKEITVGGWIRSIRDSKTFGFIVVNDGTFFETLQVVYHDTMENFADISKLNVGAAIIVKGTLVATPQAKRRNENGLTKKQQELEDLRARVVALKNKGFNNSQISRELSIDRNKVIRLLKI